MSYVQRHPDAALMAARKARSAAESAAEELLIVGGRARRCGRFVSPREVRTIAVAVMDADAEVREGEACALRDASSGPLTHRPFAMLRRGSADDGVVACILLVATVAWALAATMAYGMGL